MSKDRKKAESFILKYIQKIDPSGNNKKIYEELFASLNDKEFEELREAIRSGEASLTIFAPERHKEIRLDADRNRKILKELGVDIYQRITIKEGDNEYSPTTKFQVLDMPVRLAAQHIMKNFTAHKSTRVRNTITGQVAGESASGELSNMESQILKSIGIDKGLRELLGIRGGDVGASNAFKGILMKQGRISERDIQPFITKTQVGKTVKAYLRAMHIESGV